VSGVLPARDALGLSLGPSLGLSLGPAPVAVVLGPRAAHPFAGYVTEILDVEGFPWHRVFHERGSGDADGNGGNYGGAPLEAREWTRAPVVVLGYVDASPELVEAVLRYVYAGGGLLVLRPSPALAAGLGLRDTGADLISRYVEIHGSGPLGAGMDVPALQFHGRADLLVACGDGVQVAAHLAVCAGQPLPNPAVAFGRLGRGRWAAFTYDLAGSTVLFHQGRQDQASAGPVADADGDGKYAPNDLFVNHLDPALCRIPQADLHQDLFVRSLQWVAPPGPPLPRLWHFPHSARATAFFRGDGDRMTREDFDRTIAAADRHGVPFTTYLMLQDHAVVTPERADELRRNGHDFAQHAYTGRLPSPDEMRACLRDELAAFAHRYGETSVTYRGHSNVWVGWSEMARYLSENGVRLDTTFIPERFFAAGYLNGSGLPVRFVDGDGAIIDLYEQATLHTEPSLLTDKCFRAPLSVEEALAETIALADGAIDRYHTVYQPNFHPVYTRPGARSVLPWIEGLMAHCRARGFHFTNGRDWVRFNDARRSVTLDSLMFDPHTGVQDFQLTAAVDVEGLTLALPCERDGLLLTGASIDGESVAVDALPLEGQKHVLLSAKYVRARPRVWRLRWTTKQS